MKYTLEIEFENTANCLMCPLAELEYAAKMSIRCIPKGIRVWAEEKQFLLDRCPLELIDPDLGAYVRR